MKKLLAGVSAFALASTSALAQTYPSPTFNGFTDLSPGMTAISQLVASTSTTFPQTKTVVAGFAAVGDGGGGTFNVGTATTANGCTIFNDASGRSWYRQDMGKAVNVKWCGAKGNGTTDDSVAFVNAVGTGKSIFVPDGNFTIQENKIVLQSGQTLQGQGRASIAPSETPGVGTVISCTTNGGQPCIKVAGQNWITIRDLTEIRTGTLGSMIAGSGGIVYLRDCQNCMLDNVQVFNNSIGFQFGGATFSTARNLITSNNTSHGVLMQNTADGNALQWFMDNVLSQLNGGWGYVFQTSASFGPTVMSLENMSNIFSFANTSGGMLVAGTSTVPLFGPRVTNAFLGQDGGPEIELFGFGGAASVTNSYLELAGTTTTGPNNTTPQSNVGAGLLIENGSNIAIANNTINQMSDSGIINVGGLGVSITGNRITNNGMAAASGNTSGVLNMSGATLDLTGNTIQNTAGSSAQTNAVNNAGTINVSLGNNLKPNTTSTYTGTAATIGGATLNNQ